MDRISAQESGLSNDARGWIMSSASALACILGASVICVDIIAAKIPRWSSFRIQESDSFLAASLSLSFGVMMFSSLFNILPSSKAYLENDGFSDRNAGLIMIAAFGVGVVGISAISRFLHQFMPSHVVPCDHEHEEADDQNKAAYYPSTSHLPTDTFDPIPPMPPSETTPLLLDNSICQPGSSTFHHPSPLMPNLSALPGSHLQEPLNSHPTKLNHPGPLKRQLSMVRVKDQVMSFLQDTKANCDESGPCYGYRDPCGNTCFNVRSRSLGPSSSNKNKQESKMKQEEQPPLGLPNMYMNARRGRSSTVSSDYSHSHVGSCAHSHYSYEPSVASHDDDEHDHHHHHDHHDHDHDHHNNHPCVPQYGPALSDLEGQHAADSKAHHHHVPSTPFLSIGLQTSIAIGLHKFPEGFITYATNHANPKLGFAVFFALLVHNIAEGFSLGLPLYLALGSRTKAIAWSALLGGLSQPVGAGAAALWFNCVKTPPGDAIYGVLFASTAGIMVGVGLQLFSEGLALRHDRDICVWFAFVGMALMGVSSALVGH